MSRVEGVGVAFCGGGFRSFSEVAVVEEMERQGIPIGAVAGTSMGSLVAALVASSTPAGEMADILIALDNEVVRQGLLQNMGLKAAGGLIAGKHGALDSELLYELAGETLAKVGVSSMDDFSMPVAFPATDIMTGELCVFTNDPKLFGDANGGWTCLTGSLDVARCITASASYPLVISPTEYLGRTFMDGGCRMNLPTALFDRASVDAVVGVGMMRQAKPLDGLTPLSIALRTMSSGANQLDRIYSQAADIYVNLPVSGDDAFQAGTGLQVMAEARQMLEEHPVDWSAARPSALTALRRNAVDALAKMLRPEASY